MLAAELVIVILLWY